MLRANKTRSAIILMVILAAACGGGGSTGGAAGPVRVVLDKCDVTDVDPAVRGDNPQVWFEFSVTLENTEPDVIDAVEVEFSLLLVPQGRAANYPRADDGSAIWEMNVRVPRSGDLVQGSLVAGELYADFLAAAPRQIVGCEVTGVRIEYGSGAPDEYYPVVVDAEVRWLSRDFPQP